MRVASIRLQNFKRFTDLIIRDIPDTARLVVIVGPNGCGKSSLFDALLHWYRLTVGFGHGGDELYFRKSPDRSFGWYENVAVTLHGNAAPQKGSLYVRTAYRNDPDFSVSGFNRPNVPSETVRFSRVIENDQTVSENYQRLVYDTMAGVYDSANDAKTVQVLREELIGNVRASMRRVFGDLVLHSISDPLGSGAFFFEKGTAKSYHYKNLSGGEKAAFDLLLDLHVKKRFFPDAIYCIDEIEAHLKLLSCPQLVNRIAIEELESWYFGDWEAVRKAFPRVALTVPNRKRYREPDAIEGAWEAFERVMQEHGYFRSGLAKIESARRIGTYLDSDRCRSRSFQVFCDTLVEAAT
jgi:energy-coupling factor transporter ATP-binding protein EcfA2